MVHFVRKRKLIYTIPLLSLIFCTLYLFGRNDKSDNFFQLLHNRPDSHPFENTCNFPILEDEDRSLKDSIEHAGSPSCPFVYPNQVVNRSMYGTFFISTYAIVSPFQCYVQILSGGLRPNLSRIILSDPLELPLDKHFIVNEDVFLISCTSDFNKFGPGQEIFSRVYMGLKIKEKKDLVIGESEVDEESESADVPSRAFDVKSMSISILVFDSTSRTQFARHMKKSSKIMNEMGFVTLLGYNKVGDNSAPNLSPILAEPYKENEDYDLMDETGDIALKKFLPFARKIDPETIDFIWKKMKKKGCETFFNDDVMHTARGLFHYSTKQFTPGFTKKPTDHYYRPFYNHFYKMMKNKWKLCWDGQLLTEKMLMPWFLPLRIRSDRRIFSFNFITSPSHDNPNNLESVDEVLAKRLQVLNNSGSLSNTLLVIMGDHGQRMHPSQNTFAGRIEERQPLFSMLLPKKFRKRYPKAYDHLLTNVHRLTSNVDIHETLLDIVDNRFGKRRPKGRGRSLFTPIPTSRTCFEAWIPKNFCLCQHEVTEEDKTMAYYEHSSLDLHNTLRKYIRSFRCLDTATLHCSSNFSLFHPHKSVRYGMRTKGNWSDNMQQMIIPTGFFTETRCSIRSTRNNSLTLLVRSRVDESGANHSIPYSPMIVEAEGYCAKIKNLETYCTCDRVDEAYDKIVE